MEKDENRIEKFSINLFMFPPSGPENFRFLILVSLLSLAWFLDSIFMLSNIWVVWTSDKDQNEICIHVRA